MEQVANSEDGGATASQGVSLKVGFNPYDPKLAILRTSGITPFGEQPERKLNVAPEAVRYLMDPEGAKEYKDGKPISKHWLISIAQLLLDDAVDLLQENAELKRKMDLLSVHALELAAKLDAPKPPVQRQSLVVDRLQRQIENLAYTRQKRTESQVSK